MVTMKSDFNAPKKSKMSKLKTNNKPIIAMIVSNFTKSLEFPSTNKTKQKYLIKKSHDC